MPYVRKNQKMARRKKAKRPANKKVKVSPNIKAYVSRVLNRKLEDKHVANVSQPTTQISAMTTTQLNPINLASIWTLSQGTGQGNRIGNVVHPKKWRIKGYFSQAFGAPSSSPVIIKMYIYKLKSGFGVPGSSLNFYQNGNNNIAPSGTFSDQLKNVNLDFYTLYTTRLFKIGSATQLGTTAGTGNNDFLNIKAFNINCLKYQKSAIKFSDTTGAPNNTGLYMSYTACYADGSAIGTGNIPNITWEIEGSFEDA